MRRRGRPPSARGWSASSRSGTRRCWGARWAACACTRWRSRCSCWRWPPSSSPWRCSCGRPPAKRSGLPPTTCSTASATSCAINTWLLPQTITFQWRWQSASPASIDRASCAGSRTRTEARPSSTPASTSRRRPRRPRSWPCVTTLPLSPARSRAARVASARWPCPASRSSAGCGRFTSGRTLPLGRSRAAPSLPKPRRSERTTWTMRSRWASSTASSSSHSSSLCPPCSSTSRPLSSSPSGTSSTLWLRQWSPNTDSISAASSSTQTSGSRGCRRRRG
mmetsp:Transcript_3798/g.12017  ORF Transcript_3798/g.12017 Transcript_3798/m.12017 type:complete len:279 (-) Transcript_3798:690-1526(-)